jgi:hypothetical protein
MKTNWRTSKLRFCPKMRRFDQMPAIPVNSIICDIIFILSGLNNKYLVNARYSRKKKTIR